MSIASDCWGCTEGDHVKHQADHAIREGLIGGVYCDCEGDCAERLAASTDALMREIADALDAGSET